LSKTIKQHIWIQNSADLNHVHKTIARLVSLSTSDGAETRLAIGIICKEIMQITGNDIQDLEKGRFSGALWLGSLKVHKSEGSKLTS
jgi:hypothetical protein